MAESSAARKFRDESQARVIGNRNFRQAPDTGRALSYIRSRRNPANDNAQGRVLPTLDNPALQQAAANDNGEEAPDEYGAEERASKERMSAINRGAGDADAGEESGDAYDQAVGQHVADEPYGDEEGAEDEDDEQARALTYNRQRAADRSSRRQNPQVQAEEERQQAARDKQKAIAKQLAQQEAKTLLQAEIGATGVGIILLILWWNYEVILEGGQPTWKVLCVVLVDMLCIFSVLAAFLGPIILFVAVFSAGVSFLPESLQSIFF